MSMMLFLFLEQLHRPPVMKHAAAYQNYVEEEPVQAIRVVNTIVDSLKEWDG